MAGDLMWGGVPRILPSDTCLKYQNDVKTKVLVRTILKSKAHSLGCLKFVSILNWILYNP